MSQNPRIVLTSLTVAWPSAQYPVYVRAGTIVDITPGSAMEIAYGTATNLASLSLLSRDEIQDKSALSN